MSGRQESMAKLLIDATVAGGELARDTLVHRGRIVEPVADHNLSRLEGGKNQFAHELRAAGRKKEELGLGDECVSLRGMLQQVANAVTRSSSAGFARGQARLGGLVQPSGKVTNLGRFAAALGTLESNK